MTPAPKLPIGERVIKTWPARRVGDATNRSASGDLVLTTHAIRFEPRAGFFGRSRGAGSVRAAPLENVDAASPHRSELRIGYGDRVVFEGVIVAGATYEFDQRVRSRKVLEEMATARRLRRKELGLSDDLTSCRSCGKWVPTGDLLCAACTASRRPSS